MIILQPEKTLQQLSAIVIEWRSKFPSNKEGDIIIQTNQKFMANIRLTDNALHTIQQHSKGFEMIPTALQHPDECWAQWKDATKQREVIRHYILFGELCYIVKTLDSIVQDAFAVTPAKCDQFRKGAIL